MDAGAGGHTRTSLTIAEALTTRGHHVTFVTGENRNSPVLAASAFDVVKIPISRIGTYDQLGALVDQLVKEKALDVVHTFAYFGLTQLADVCKRYNLPLWWTICGEAPLRPLDYDFLKFRSIVTLSQEVKDGLIEMHGLSDDDVVVIPARLNLQKVLRQASVSDQLFDDFRKKYNIAANSKIIFRVARVHAAYENSLLQSIEVSKRLNYKGLDVCFVHIGYVQQDKVYDKVKTAVQEANKELGRTIAVTARDEALDALSYLGMADIVVGTGRAAFEAMLASKPTLVVGKNGFAGLVSAETVDALAHYNFSGRNIVRWQDFDKSVSNIAEAAEIVLTNVAVGEAVSHFGRRYVIAKLDADIAAEKYESLYNKSMLRPVLPKKVELVRSETLFKAKSLWRYLLSEQKRAYLKALWRQESPSKG